MAWWLLPRTPDPEVGGSRPSRVIPCCVLEQGTFTPQKVLVIPRKGWLRPNMTEKLFTGMLRINQSINRFYFFTCSIMAEDGDEGSPKRSWNRRRRENSNQYIPEESYGKINSDQGSPKRSRDRERKEDSDQHSPVVSERKL